MAEQQRYIDPFSKAVHAAPATVDQLMRVGVADLAKEKAGCDEKADFRSDAEGLIGQRVDDKNKDAKMRDAKRDREPRGGGEFAIVGGGRHMVDRFVEDRGQRREKHQSRQNPPPAPNCGRPNKGNGRECSD